MTQDSGRTAAQQRKWASLTMIRPHYDFDSGGSEVEVSNPILKERYTLSRDAALALLSATETDTPDEEAAAIAKYFADEGLLHPKDVDEDFENGIRHWLDRGWDPSVDFYLWTRDLEFIDQPSGSNFEEVRDHLLATLDAQPGVKRPSPRTMRDSRPIGKPAPLPREPLGDVLRRRANAPNPRERALPETLLNSLLWHGLAPIRYPGDDLESYDALINLGRLYEIFFVAHDVSGIDPGVYYYDTNLNSTELVRSGRFREEVERAIIGQHHARTAACTFIVAADYRLTQWQYRHNRTLRAFYVDAGKIVQHLILIATAHRLSTSMSAAINDQEMGKLLGLDPVNEQTFFTLAVG